MTGTSTDSLTDLVVRGVDQTMELTVVPSFTSIGYAVRSRLEGWAELPEGALSGRTVAITGVTSGLGAAAARRLAELGADLVVVGRDPDRTNAAADRLATGGASVTAVVADLGELDQVRAAAERIAASCDRLDALVHNAGALGVERRTNSDGVEATVASQVVGPHLLTTLLLPALRAASPGRVVTMSSGGMYAAGLTVDELEMPPERYRGSEQYARAKRAQVTLNEMWAERVPASEVVFHAVHPGWADTPGVASSLPRFHRLVGPALRTPDQGADTLVWAIADDGEPRTTSGRFWHDRRPRAIHKLPTTRRTDTPERRRELWELVERLAGTGDAAP